MPPRSKTGVACPKCDEGEVVERRSKRGLRFYGCDRFPKCTFTTGGMPVAEACPECGSPYLLGSNQRLRCPNRGCDYVKRAAPSSPK